MADEVDKYMDDQTDKEFMGALRQEGVDVTIPRRKGYTFTFTTDIKTAFLLHSQINKHPFSLKELWEQYTDTLIVKVNEAGLREMSATDREAGQKISGEVNNFAFTINTRFTLTAQGISFTAGEEVIVFKPGKTGQWEEWYTADKTLDALIAILKPPEGGAKTTRRTCPSDAVKLQPFNENLPLWNQHNLSKLVLGVATSNPNTWTHVPKKNGFLLKKEDSGIAILENIGAFDNLKKILKLLGPEGLQYTLAILAHIEETIRRTYSNPPESITGINPMRIVVSDLLRTMGKKPDGNTFKREKQFRTRNFLKAQSMVEYFDIKPTKTGKPTMRIGPLITINSTEIESNLPFEDIPESGEVVSIIVTPGPVVYELMRKGIRWCHPRLLEYHPNNQKYEIAMGFYIRQLAANKRGKQDQDYVTIRAIERGSGVGSFDSNPRRRMAKIVRALNRLAEDGLIPGEYNAKIDKYQAVLTQSKNNSRLDSVESTRETMARVVAKESLPNGYTPLLCTTNPP